MNNFENFILAAVKAVVAAAPAAAPIFIHSNKGAAIFNVSDAFAAALLAQFHPTPQAG